MTAAITETLRPRTAAVRRSGIAAIAGSILGTQAVTSALGFVFWTVTARGLPASTVGQLGSATAATTLLGSFGVLGCGTLLISRLGAVHAGERRQFLVTAVLVSLGGSGALAIAFGLGAWLLIPAFGFLSPQHTAFWWLLAAATLTSAGGVFDQAMLVVGKPTMQVVRNTVSSGLKVVLLAGALFAGLHGMVWGLAAWAIGQLAADVMAFRTAWRLTPTREPVTVRGVRATVVRYWREAVGHHGMNISLAAPSMLQPVVISAVISAESNAVFTTVRLISMLAFMAPYALAMALFASSGAEPRDFEQRARSTFWLSLGLSLALYVGLFMTAPAVLEIFGRTYAAGGVSYLRIIAMACPLLVFKDQYIARVRAHRQLTRAMPYVLCSTVLEIGGTLVGAVTADLAGALFGWLLALALGAAWVYWQWRDERARSRTTDATAAAAPSSTGCPVPGSRAPRIGGVSVVVCTYDMARFEQLLTCLQSIRHQTLAPKAVIIVVDGCASLTEALLRRNGPETIVALPVNQGLSAARNTGVAHVATEWVAFLDDDAVADPTWLERLVNCAEGMGAVGAGGWSEPVFDRPKPRWLPAELLWAVGCSYRGMPTQRTIERNIYGGCAVLKTDLFDLVGGYDVTLGRRGSGVEGGEEADLCLRATAANPKARFAHVPDAVIRHRVGADRLTPVYVLGRCYSDGRTKSLIASRSGTRALNSEWGYVAKVLPRGVVRGLVSGQWQAAFTLTAGVVSAAAGYAVGRIHPRRRCRTAFAGATSGVVE